MALPTLLLLSGARAQPFPFPDSPDFALSIANLASQDFEGTPFLHVAATGAVGNDDLTLKAGENVFIANDIYTLAQDAVFAAASRRAVVDRAFLMHSGGVRGFRLQPARINVTNREWISENRTQAAALTADVQRINAHVPMAVTAAIRDGETITYLDDSDINYDGEYSASRFLGISVSDMTNRETYKISPMVLVPGVLRYPDPGAGGTSYSRQTLSRIAGLGNAALPFKYPNLDGDYAAFAWAFTVPPRAAVMRFTEPMSIDYATDSAIAYAGSSEPTEIWGELLTQQTSQALIEDAQGVQVQVQQITEWRVRRDVADMIAPGASITESTYDRTFEVTSVDLQNRRFAVVTASRTEDA